MIGSDKERVWCKFEIVELEPQFIHDTLKAKKLLK